MDWDHTIKAQRQKLAAIAVALLGMLAACAGRSAILRILRPAESALRRLIVIYQREVLPTGTLPHGNPERDDRPVPDFSAFGSHNGRHRPAFRLIDPRKRFDWLNTSEAQAAGPRIWCLGMERDGRSGMAPLSGTVQPCLDHLKHRIAAFDHAVKTLPAQAQRLSRVMARRAYSAPGPGCVGPIRPGLPPGWRRKRIEPVDDILRDCHGLAVDEVIRPP